MIVKKKFCKKVSFRLTFAEYTSCRNISTTTKPRHRLQCTNYLLQQTDWAPKFIRKIFQVHSTGVVQPRMACNPRLRTGMSWTEAAEDQFSIAATTRHPVFLQLPRIPCTCFFSLVLTLNSMSVVLLIEELRVRRLVSAVPPAWRIWQGRRCPRLNSTFVP